MGWNTLEANRLYVTYKTYWMHTYVCLGNPNRICYTYFILLSFFTSLLNSIKSYIKRHSIRNCQFDILCENDKIFIVSFWGQARSQFEFGTHQLEFRNRQLKSRISIWKSEVIIWSSEFVNWIDIQNLRK